MCHIRSATDLHVRLIDFVYHSTLGWRVITKNKEDLHIQEGDGAVLLLGSRGLPAQPAVLCCGGRPTCLLTAPVSTTSIVLVPHPPLSGSLDKNNPSRSEGLQAGHVCHASLLRSSTQRAPPVRQNSPAMLGLCDGRLGGPAYPGGRRRRSFSWQPRPWRQA